jgi:hypothetical protein
MQKMLFGEMLNISAEVLLYSLVDLWLIIGN